MSNESSPQVELPSGTQVKLPEGECVIKGDLRVLNINHGFWQNFAYVLFLLCGAAAFVKYLAVG